MVQKIENDHQFPHLRFLILIISHHHPYTCQLTLKAQRKNVSENVVCLSRLLQIIALHFRQIKYRRKQLGPRTDCSGVHTVCYRGFLNISADMKSRRLSLRLGQMPQSAAIFEKMKFFIKRSFFPHKQSDYEHR